MNMLHNALANTSFGNALAFESVSVLFIAIALWDLLWKGIALWTSARNYQKRWFIVLLILQTAGIAPIIYLLFFRTDRQPGVTASLFNNPAPEPVEKEAIVAENPKS